MNQTIDRRSNNPSERRTSSIPRRQDHRKRKSLDPVFDGMKAYIKTSDEPTMRRLLLEMLGRIGK